MTQRLLPIFVSVEGARVVVTGNGPAAREVSARLRDLGARVEPGGPLGDALMLVSASEDPSEDEEIRADAARRGLLTVSAASPSGRAFLGACEQRGSLAVAATSCGRSAVLDRRLAASASPAIEPHHERFAEILASIRAKLEARIPDDATRAAIWEQILDSPVSLLLQSGSDEEALEMAERMAWGTG